MNSVSSPGSVANVVVEGDLNGNENAVAFTVNFDPAKLLNPQVLLGNDVQIAQLYVNSSEPGKIGVMLALPTGQAFAAGVKQLCGA